MQDLHPCCSGSGCLHRWRPSGCPAQRRATRRSRGGTEICRALVCPTAVRSGCQCFGLRARLRSFLRIHREVPRPSPCTCWSAPSSVSRAAKATASSSGLQLLWCFKNRAEASVRYLLGEMGSMVSHAPAFWSSRAKPPTKLDQHGPICHKVLSVASDCSGAPYWDHLVPAVCV